MGSNGSECFCRHACSVWQAWSNLKGMIFSDHTEFGVLALPHDDVYRESILEFASKKALAGERVAPVYPILVST